MNLRRVVGVLGLCLTLTSGVALADYTPGKDITVSATVAPGLIKPTGWTAASSFALQEAAHSAITTGSGQSIDHSYIWIVVNGKPILAVDPMWVEYGKGTR